VVVGGYAELIGDPRTALANPVRISVISGSTGLHYSSLSSKTLASGRNDLRQSE
jgi:hypothetical protein